MASSSPLPLLLILLLASSSWPALHVAADAAGDDLKHIRVYMHETFAGPNATFAIAVPSPLGDAAFGSFGMVEVIDDELRDGPDRASAALVGRFQGLLAGTGLVAPPALQSAINLVFTAGDCSGSTLAMLGPVLDFGAPIERAVVGGTGAFRMARGYCVMTSLGNPTPESVVYQVDLYLQMHQRQHRG